jgi:sugar (pentulose or hexulose) kinase
MAIILGNSAVVNSSSERFPRDGEGEARGRGRGRKTASFQPLDVMRLNWGPYLWMRCYNNGAQFLNRVVGDNPDWEALEEQARGVGAGSGGTRMLPFVYPEPALGIERPWFRWLPKEPREPGKRFRAALEALAYLIALGVRQHEEAGKQMGRITVSGGIARSGLMCEILATVLDQPLWRLQSDEGPALGAAATALAALETHRRRQNGLEAAFTVADAVAILVRFRDSVSPTPTWRPVYQKGSRALEQMLVGKRKKNAPR